MPFDILRVVLQHHLWARGNQLERPVMRAVCFFRAVLNAAALEVNHVLISRRVRGRRSETQDLTTRVFVIQRSLAHSHVALMPKKVMFLLHGNGGSGQLFSLGLEQRRARFSDLQPLHVTKNVANSKKTGENKCL